MIGAWLEDMSTFVNIHVVAKTSCRKQCCRVSPNTALMLFLLQGARVRDLFNISAGFAGQMQIAWHLLI